MAKKDFTCPPPCEEKHSEHRITMAEIKKDLNYIKEKLDENTNQHEEIIKAFNSKADKKEVEDLNTKFWVIFSGFVMILLGIIGFLLKEKFFK